MLGSHGFPHELFPAQAPLALEEADRGRRLATALRATGQADAGKARRAGGEGWSSRRWSKALQSLQDFKRQELQADKVAVSRLLTRPGALASQWAAQLEALNWMLQGAVQPDTQAYNVVAARQAAADNGAGLPVVGRWAAVLHLSSDLASSGLRRTLVTCGNELRGYGTGLKWKRAQATLLTMACSALRLGVIACTAATAAYAGLSLWYNVVAVLAAVSRQLLELDLIAYNAAAAVLESNERWADVLLMLATLPGASIEVDVVSQNTAISSLRSSPHWRLAFATVRRMHSLGTHGDVVTRGALLGALKPHHLWQSVLELTVDRSSRTPATSSVVAANTAMQTCEKASKWSWTVYLLEDSHVVTPKRFGCQYPVLRSDPQPPLRRPGSRERVAPHALRPRDVARAVARSRN
eukprot:TRINITY_DN24058_c0_g1_i2.p1 TRINITY_DN24058_c0_g1~~TRINITY_DN24058_c0_g1_i2.p1  ORF type:complete len:410 (+),score=78.56 TRINITY_DN24058_c0_g1_i2:118-1347(+)